MKSIQLQQSNVPNFIAGFPKIVISIHLKWSSWRSEKQGKVDRAINEPAKDYPRIIQVEMIHRGKIWLLILTGLKLCLVCTGRGHQRVRHQEDIKHAFT